MNAETVEHSCSSLCARMFRIQRAKMTCTYAPIAALVSEAVVMTWIGDRTADGRGKVQHVGGSDYDALVDGDYVGTYPSRDAAMRAVETRIERR